MITIFGKTQCPYCEMARKDAQAYGLEYEYKNIEYKKYLDELLAIKPDANQVPIIFYNDVLIGNYKNFLDYLKKTC